MAVPSYFQRKPFYALYPVPGVGSCWGQEGGLAREEGLVGGPLLLNHLQACLHYTQHCLTIHICHNHYSHLPQPLLTTATTTSPPANPCSVLLTDVIILLLLLV